VDIFLASREILLVELEENYLELYNLHENNQEKLA
jgi:hypothetical protein